MPRSLRTIALSCLAASALTALMLIFGPQEGLETLATGLLLYFTLLYHAFVGPLFIWHGIKHRPLSISYLLFMPYLVVMWGIGLTIYVKVNDIDDAARDVVEARTEPANFQIREIGRSIYINRTGRLSSDDRALWHQYGREADDVNRSDESRRPALWYAAAVGDLEMVRILLEKKALTDDEELYYTTPLAVAVKEGHHDVVSALIDAGADVDEGENNEKPSLSVAVRNTDVEMVSLLIENGADPNLGYPPPFTTALKAGEVELVAMLLDAGAEPKVFFQNKHPVEVAIHDNNDEMLDVLLKKTPGVNALSEGREPMLFIAAAACDLESFQRYLSIGADPNIRNRKGLTLIDHFAYQRRELCGFERSREQFIEHLIDAGVDLQHVNEKGESPAIVALYVGQVALAKFLAKQGANLNGLRANKDFLMLAARTGDIELIEAAVNAGQDPTHFTEGMNGSNALTGAVRSENLEAVRYLISQGATFPPREGAVNILFGMATKDMEMLRVLLEEWVKQPADQRNDDPVKWGIRSSGVKEAWALAKSMGIQE